jgi:hypothetical protein
MRPIGPVRRLALKVHDRMEKIVEGRQWMGAHMRRGDCKFLFSLLPELLLNKFIAVVDHGWAMDSDLKNHFGRIKDRLSSGRKLLEKIYTDKDIQPYDVPDVKPEKDVFDRPPPKEGDS